MTDMREALTEARNYIAADRDRLLNDFCTLTPERTPDRASMEDNERAIVDEADKVLALIEAALAAPTPPVVQSPAPGLEPRGCPTPGACSCPATPAPVQAGEPVAWQFEFHDRLKVWKRAILNYEPTHYDGYPVRDVVPLYLGPSDAYARGAEDMDRDIGILLASIDFLEEATGEGPEGEDAAMIAQIRADHEARTSRALPLTEQGGR